MRSYFLPVLAALALSLLTAGCASYSGNSTTPLSRNRFSPCDGRPKVNLLGLNKEYQSVASDSCKLGIRPTDLSSWVEAPLNSHRQRGLKRITLGCTNLTPDSADCNYGGLPGHSVSTLFDFDTTAYPETAQVLRAVVAIHIQKNTSFFVKAVQLRARMMTGDTLQSVGANYLLPPTEPGWVLFDVTDVAARAINERRPALHFEVSLPCGRSESELVLMSLLDAEPKLIVEFR